MNHLTIDQCKNLKEWGYLQESKFLLCKYDNETVWRHEYLEDTLGYPGDDYYACPTLEELIEWLGDDIHALYHSSKGWEAVDSTISVKYVYGTGKTPLEAVYALCEALKGTNEN